MKERLISFLQPFAKSCFSLVDAIPLGIVALLFVAVLAVIALWVVTLKNEKPTCGAHGYPLFWRDLRFWAICILVAQAAIYIIFR
jgi:hypothetical protein